MIDNERIYEPDRADHSIPIWASGTWCAKCGDAAAHKVEETSAPWTFHPLTAYLCCNCFSDIMGFASHEKYPYDTP